MIADFTNRGDLRFVVSCNEENGLELWIVKLVIPALNAWYTKSNYSHIFYVGKGVTMEAAYRDMLKKTALELFNRGY